MLNLTTVSVSYRDDTFEGLLDPGSIEDIIGGIDRLNAQNDLSQSDAWRWIINSIESNDHLSDEIKSAIANTLLWLACCGDVGEQVIEQAKAGGVTIHFEITESRASWEFRLAVYPTDPPTTITLH